jgi:hypothetical protein
MNSGHQRLSQAACVSGAQSQQGGLCVSDQS